MSGLMPLVIPGTLAIVFVVYFVMDFIAGLFGFRGIP